MKDDGGLYFDIVDGRLVRVTERPWWWLEETTAAWCQRVREDYPDDANNMDDEEVRETYADGNKYADTWDHLGDARESIDHMMDVLNALAARAAKGGDADAQG
jgi:hypothetical protein